MKQFLTFILAILCSTSIALADTYTGTTGDCTYTLDTSDSTLVISGSGAMADYSPSSYSSAASSSAPWYSYRSYVKTITIEDGVTSIGNYAFYKCTSLTSINIPESVTSIGSDAFYYCTSLTSITIPESVTSIGSYAFYYCTSLTSITIPESVTSIGSYAFRFCSSLTSITIPESVTSIGDYAFYNCSSLTSITIPESVTSIGSSAFSNCSSLTSITIPDAVTSIGSYAFYDCSSLTSVTIGSGVTSIGDYAFYDCSSLTTVTSLATVPPDCSSNTFSSDTYEQATLYAASIAYAYASYWKKFTNIEYNDTTFTYYCGDNLTFTLDFENGTLTISGSGDMYDYSSSSDVPWHQFYSYITSVTLPEGLTSICNYAFRYCSSLTSITIPDGVTSIGNYAFYECTSLTSINIPDGVTSIGDYAFYYCSSLKKILIPENVTSIGNYAFYGCSKLTTVYSLNETPPTVYQYTFSSIYEQATLYAPELYQSRSYWKEFYTIYVNSGSCGDDLTWLYCDGTLTISGSGAMSNFYEDESPWYEDFSGSITTVVIGSEVTTIGTYAFYNLINLTSVYSYNETAPTARSTSFDSDTYKYATLYVTSDDYATADYWENFTKSETIEEEEEEEENNAITSVAASTSTIRTAGSTIVITTETAQTAQVYSLSGQLVTKRAVFAGETSIGMPTGGVYVVALADGTRAKVLVK